MTPLYPATTDEFHAGLRALPLADLQERLEFYAWELAELEDADLAWPRESRAFTRYLRDQVQGEIDRRETLALRADAPAWPSERMINPELWQRMKDQVDLKAMIEWWVPGIAWQRAGEHLRARCPFLIHADTSPSFTLYPDHFFCFGCGIGGTVFDFVMTIMPCTFAEAVTEVRRLTRIGSEERAQGPTTKEGSYFIHGLEVPDARAK